MPNLPNKPFIFLNKTPSPNVIEFRVDWELDELNDIHPCWLESEVDDVLYISLTPSSTAGFDINGVIQYDLASSSLYNPNLHHKVTLVIRIPNSNAGGFVSVFPANNDVFQAPNPANEEIKPYLWLKFIAADKMILYVLAYLPKACNVVEILPATDDFIKGTRMIRFEAHPNPAYSADEMEYMILQHNLDVSTGFDPVLETVLVEVAEMDSTGTSERRKGQGTVHTSEGDASGND